MTVRGLNHKVAYQKRLILRAAPCTIQGEREGESCLTGYGGTVGATLFPATTSEETAKTEPRCCVGLPWPHKWHGAPRWCQAAATYSFVCMFHGAPFSVCWMTANCGLRRGLKEIQIWESYRHSAYKAESLSNAFLTIPLLHCNSASRPSRKCNVWN
jgi:hypothetical protein